MKKKSILLIEESESIRKIITLTCQKLGQYVENLFILSNPAELMGMIKKRPIDLIFSNIEFSDFPDFYVPRIIKEHQLGIPVYLITTSTLNETLTQVAYHSGSLGIIRPLKNLKLLFDAIETIIRETMTDSFYAPQIDAPENSREDVDALSEHLRYTFQDMEKQVMESNEMIISMMLELNREKEKVRFWENQIKEYHRKFKTEAGEI
ncbi:MAG: response regulator [Candidatus Delongbacteria bacterium]|nr:response regulator [Candidatus Delongbacteria bacterium]